MHYLSLPNTFMKKGSGTGTRPTDPGGPKTCGPTLNTVTAACSLPATLRLIEEKNVVIVHLSRQQKMRGWSFIILL
jgi:hypothetical protein